MSGVLAPLTLLALDVTLTHPAALAVLAMFISGIGWLMVYLWVEVRRLSAPPRTDDTGRNGHRAGWFRGVRPRRRAR
ncbi:hypothetical protein M2316_002385 [Cellulosimicrobium cellulans]|nr:hypothetical protein [Cellulosimicrobium cellulans]